MPGCSPAVEASRSVVVRHHLQPDGDRSPIRPDHLLCSREQRLTDPLATHVVANEEILDHAKGIGGLIRALVDPRGEEGHEPHAGLGDYKVPDRGLNDGVGVLEAAGVDFALDQCGRLLIGMNGHGLSRVRYLLLIVSSDLGGPIARFGKRFVPLSLEFRRLGAALGDSWPLFLENMLTMKRQVLRCPFARRL
jgi:hypothetical protein